MATKPNEFTEEPSAQAGAFQFDTDHFIANLPCLWIVKTVGHGSNVMWLALTLFWRFCSRAHYGRLRISHRQLAIGGMRPEAVGPAMRTLIDLGMVRVLEVGSGRKQSLYELEFGAFHNDEFKVMRAWLLKKKEGKKKRREDDAAKGDAEPSEHDESSDD